MSEKEPLNEFLDKVTVGDLQDAAMSIAWRKSTYGLTPLGRAVLVEPYEPEFSKSVIVRPDNVAERSMMVEMRAVVLAIGSNAWANEPARAKVGDKVLVAKYAGVMCKSPVNGKRLRVVNDNDIFLRIDAEEMPQVGEEAA